MMITLHNWFHGTTTTIHAGPISDARATRIRRRLCPSPTCTCSGRLGTRPGDQPGQPGIDGGCIELHDNGWTAYAATSQPQNPPA